MDGNCWTDPVLINPKGDETDLLHLGDGRWLASSRQKDLVNLFRSEDVGRTWTCDMPLTLPGQVARRLAQAKRSLLKHLPPEVLERLRRLRALLRRLGLAGAQAPEASPQERPRAGVGADGERAVGRDADGGT